MADPILSGIVVALLVLIFAAWRRYLWVAKNPRRQQEDTCPYSLKDVFGEGHLVKVPHQKGAQWLTEIFSRSAKRFPGHTALQIPHTGESLTFAELDTRAESVAAALSPHLTGPDQVVVVAMAQDNWQIVASHLGVLKAGGTVMFLDTTLPNALITHMLEDSRPVVVLTRGLDSFRGLPTLDVMKLPEKGPGVSPPGWLDDPTQRLATIFYTSGTTGRPKGVECPHAGYVDLALSYADSFDLVPGMDASSLTSSLGYDGSISEMYSAWVSGCAVMLLTKGQSDADETRHGLPLPSRPGDAGEGGPIDTVAEVPPGGEKVLAICREVFDSPLDWDDAFADHGGHSIVIARLAQRLQAEGWAVPVRALLSDCDTPRKVAHRARIVATPVGNPVRDDRERTALHRRGAGSLVQLLVLQVGHARGVVVDAWNRRRHRGSNACVGRSGTRSAVLHGGRD